MGWWKVRDMLTVKDMMRLGFERTRWEYAGAKEARVRFLFNESATRYYQALNHLIDQPAALAYDPMTVRRLRRLRDARAQARFAAAREWVE